MAQAYDAIIVGGEHNGLTAAVIWQRPDLKHWFLKNELFWVVHVSRRKYIPDIGYLQFHILSDFCVMRKTCFHWLN